VAAPHDVHGVWLEGSYPETRLVVAASRGREQSRMSFGLWDDEFGKILPDDSNRASPAYVSSEIKVAVWELNY
jgi:hypothetical protein